MKNKRDILEEFGLDDKASIYYAKQDDSDSTWAWLAAIRFVRPIQKSLMRYKKDYSRQMSERLDNGYNVSNSFRALKKAGISDEVINNFVYEIAIESYNDVLYRISDPAGSDYDLDDDGDNLATWKLIEIDKDNRKTGRYIPELHNLIPYN